MLTECLSISIINLMRPSMVYFSPKMWCTTLLPSQHDVFSLNWILVWSHQSTQKSIPAAKQTTLQHEKKMSIICLLQDKPPLVVFSRLSLLTRIVKVPSSSLQECFFLCGLKLKKEFRVLSTAQNLISFCRGKFPSGI